MKITLPDAVRDLRNTLKAISIQNVSPVKICIRVKFYNLNGGEDIRKYYLYLHASTGLDD